MSLHFCFILRHLCWLLLWLFFDFAAEFLVEGEDEDRVTSPLEALGDVEIFLDCTLEVRFDVEERIRLCCLEGRCRRGC